MTTMTAQDGTGHRTGHLHGKVAIVTGSSRGIGAAVAAELARQGARVVVNARGADAAKAASEAIEGSIPIATDVTNSDDVDRLVGETLDRLGQVDILVNNAGMPMKRDSLELTREDWDAAVALNLTGPLVCSQAAGRAMLERGSGCIVNMASVTSFNTFPQSLGYAVTKAALVMMTKVLAIEWAPVVRVNAVAPGVVATDFTIGLRERGLLDFDAVERRTPMGRLDTPTEVGQAVAFLASDRASYITGETLQVDGGWISMGFR